MANVGKIRAELELNASNFNKNMDSAKDRVKTLEKSSLELKKSMTGIQTGAALMGGAIAVALGSSITVAANYEKQLSGIASVSGATSGEMEKLSSVIQDLSKNTAYSASETAMAAEELLKSGLTLEQVIGGGLAGALDLAAAGELQLGEAAQIASTALNAFKDDNLTVSQSADILASAAVSSATDVRELSTGLSQVSAVASAAGMSFEDVNIALATFAQNGLRGSDSGTSLKTLLMNLSPSTKEAADRMKELGIITKDGSNQFYDAQGNLKGLAEITGVLHDALDDLNPKERGEALKEMFGADAIRSGAILFKEGAEGIERMASAMDGISAADVAKKRLDNLIGAFEELRGNLETLGISIGSEFLAPLRRLTEESTDVVKILGEMDTGMLATALKAGGAAAAVALVGSSLVKLGIAARGLMVSMGPAGLIVMGLSAIAGMAVFASDAEERLTEVSLENANALEAQSSALEGNIAKFNELKNASNLSTAEFGRFLDVQEELNETIDPTKIAALKDEAARLTEKSGLTNAQLSEMARLNGELIKQVPDATDRITDQGNKVLESTSKLEEYNEKLKTMTMRELEIQRLRAESKQDELLEKVNDLQDKLNEGKQKEIDLKAEIDNFDKIAQQQRIQELKDQLESNTLSDFRKSIVEEQIRQEESKLGTLQEQLANQMEQNAKTEEKIDKTEVEIGKLDEVKQRMVDKLLLEQDITNEKGDGIQKLDESISKLKTERENLINNASAAEKKTVEYKEALGYLDKEISELGVTKAAINDVTGAQSRTNSKVAEGIALAQRLNDVLSKRIDKTVNITEIKRLITQSERAARSIGVDTSRHQGGTFERPKFHSGGSPNLSMPPSHHEIDVRLLRNEMVLTEAQQASLFSMLNAPVASGSNGGLTTEDITAIINAASNAKQPVEIPLFIDSYEVARATWPVVDQFQATQASNDFRNKGGKN
jgi:TP901 family phage tail tape measure protein